MSVSEDETSDPISTMVEGIGGIRHSLQGQITALTAICGVLARACAANGLDAAELEAGIADTRALLPDNASGDAERVIDLVIALLRHPGRVA